MQVVSFDNPAIDVTYFHSIDQAASFAVGGRYYGGVFIAMNAEKMVKLYRDPDLFINVKNPVYYPDGVSMLWFRSDGTPRIPGVELWLQVLRRTEKEAGTVLVIGATPNVSNEVHLRIGELAPNLEYRCIDGFRSEIEYSQLMEAIEPDVVFVGMGSPRQEILISRLQVEWPDCFYMGIGGSLDVLTDNAERAPEIFRKYGLEFLYRLLQEPRRIFRQASYFIFVYLYISGKFKIRRSCRME